MRTVIEQQTTQNEQFLFMWEHYQNDRNQQYIHYVASFDFNDLNIKNICEHVCSPGQNEDYREFIEAEMEISEDGKKINVGNIVAYNPATLGLCRTLSQSTSEFEKSCGHTYGKHYALHLLKCLWILWD